MGKMKRFIDLLPAREIGGRPVLGVVANNMVAALDAPAFGNLEITPLTRADALGFAIHRSTLVFLLAMCAAKLYPGAKFRARHSIGPALWCQLETDDPMPEAAAKLATELSKTVRANSPIIVEPMPYGEAVEVLGQMGRYDELHLLKHRNPPFVAVTRCGEFFALSQTTLAPSTGLVGQWELVPFDDGIVLNVPTPENPDEIKPLPYAEPYFRVFRRHVERTKITGVSSLGDLNQAILENRFDSLVRTIEALQTKELATIADKIATRNPAVRLVLLSGPSSAGKTTTAHRLCTQLQVNGLKPLIISTDDYFVGDARNPRDEDGNLDYETVDAVDTERLAADLNGLFAGNAVRLRKFDFKKHDGYDDEKTTALPHKGIVILEGIHALNPKLTRGVEDDVKFRLYLNALTQLVLDSCNRISATDTRLLRRLVRDYNFRGMSPLNTFRLWPDVVDGERKWIYPYQRQADAVFNSALEYELAVLKPHAMKLLHQVKPWSKAYLEAWRLMEMLHNVSAASDAAVPGDSILRETIGGSQLDY